MHSIEMKPCLIVTGPTCSGKSALATSLALRLRGTVINADSMQVYAGLAVLTAAPEPAATALVPHRLYGVRPPGEPGHVAWWRGAALAAIAEAHADGRLPILCGGSGMYLRALTHGLAQIPEPGDAARAEARALLEDLGAPGLHARLAAVDPVAAARLRPGDGQRIARAWEVWRGTGRSIVDWEAVPGLPAAACAFTAILLSPPRAELRAAIASRFASMLDAGALDEVRALLALSLPPGLPAMRAHAVPELAAYLAGTLTLAQASTRAVLSQGQYTKRQATWFRHHALAELHRTLIIAKRIPGLTQEMESLIDNLMPFVVGAVDAGDVAA